MTGLFSESVARKVRIISFIPCLGTGGTERVVVNLCKALDRERFAPEVCAFFGGPLAAELHDLNVPITVLADETDRDVGSLAKLFRYGGRLRDLRAVIGSREDTVVHSHHLGPLEHLFILKKMTGLRCSWLHSEHNRPDLERVSGKWFYLKLQPLAHPDCLVGVSEVVTSYLKEGCGVPPDKASTILNGIDTAKYHCIDQLEKRRELGIPGTGPLIGAVGNLRPEKNQGLLLRAVALLPREFGAQLVICGDGQCRGDLERLAADLGIAERVHFLGYRLDAHEIMALFTGFCLPSEYEGLPLSVLEAWAARVPVVATEVVGIRELIRHGEDGYLVPFGDPHKMAEALLLVLQDQDLANRLRNFGAQRVLTYGIDRMARAYETLYDKMSEHKRG